MIFFCILTLSPSADYDHWNSLFFSLYIVSYAFIFIMTTYLSYRSLNDYTILWYINLFIQNNTVGEVLLYGTKDKSEKSSYLGQADFRFLLLWVQLRLNVFSLWHMDHSGSHLNEQQPYLINNLPLPLHRQCVWSVCSFNSVPPCLSILKNQKIQCMDEHIFIFYSHDL